VSRYISKKIERRMTMKKIEMKEVTLEEIIKPKGPVLAGLMARVPDALDKEFKNPIDISKYIW
jgi:hypothetical protein